jgi:hypothetical protein
MVLTKRPQRMLDYLLKLSISPADRLSDAASDICTDDNPCNGSRPRWPLPNLIMGVSAEDQQRADERIPLLLQTPTAVRAVSCEPLLGAVDLARYLGLPPYENTGVAERVHQGFSYYRSTEDGSLQFRAGKGYLDTENEYREPAPALHWIIAGGETGPGARPMHPDWARSLRDQCAAAGVPFWHKNNGPGLGRLLDGAEHNGRPEVTYVDQH